MKQAQEFLIDLLTSTGDSHELIEQKSGVSKSTVHRLLKGQAVSSGSLRLIADAYGKLDELQKLFTTSTAQQHTADDLRERADHIEQLLTESYEDRIRALGAMIKSQQEEIIQIRAQHAKHMERMEQHFERERAALEKALQQHENELDHARRTNLRAFIAICIEGTLLLLALLALILQ